MYRKENILPIKKEEKIREKLAKKKIRSEKIEATENFSSLALEFDRG